MKKIIGILILGLSLIGCEHPITDVGNPTINQVPQAAAPSSQSSSPSISQLLGDFAISQPSANVTGGGGAPGVAASGAHVCKSDALSIKRISNGSKTDQIILENFFNYSPSTKSIVANYKQGVASFSLVDAIVDMACIGKATLVGEQVVLSFTCTVAKPVAESCSILFDRIL